MTRKPETRRARAARAAEVTDRAERRGLVVSIAILLGAVVVLVTAGVLLVSNSGSGNLEALPPGVSGVLTFHREGNIHSLALDTRSERQLTDYSSRNPLLFGARSSDGSRLATVQDEGPARTLAVTRSGQNTRQVLVSEIANRTTVAQPQWTPDGQSLLYTLHLYLLEGAILRGEIFRVEQINADGSERRTRVADGLDASGAPDGALAFARIAADRKDLRVLEPNGEERVLVSNEGFDNVAAPRFSPDGQHVAFAASGAGPSLGSRRSEPLLRLGPAVAYAHGTPWDIWLAERGGGFRPLVNLAEDEPTIAWSPDGQFLAVSGGRGVYVVEVASGQAYRVAKAGGFGGIDWTY